jgi:3-deoxy-7-phosphoheptulonate synthase
MSQSPTHHASTSDLHIRGLVALPSPHQVKAELPISDEAAATVIAAREGMKKILLGHDPRMLVIVGPCSIHDEQAAMEYARRLDALRRKVASTMLTVMRVYFEKPRTTTGWKGLVYDPHLNDTFDMAGGLRIARRLLLAINEMGLSCATEFLDPFVPQYLADLIGWAAIGARTTESQTHRQMASGLSMPVGYKNSTTGDLQVAINAMLSARTPHAFLGIDGEGRVCSVHTTGNRWGHVILRGGEKTTNYDAQAVADAAAKLEKAKLPPALMIDCSHANSGKKHTGQSLVWRSAVGQRAAGNRHIIGLMLESHLHPGRQDLPADLSRLQPGVSVTDECIGWEETERLLLEAHAQLK